MERKGRPHTFGGGLVFSVRAGLVTQVTPSLYRSVCVHSTIMSDRVSLREQKFEPA